MSELEDSLFLRALRREPVPRTPIWIMRQAGRYLPEYRATRARAGDFLTLCKTPELACEVTLQPIQRFDLDAAILFSDILTIPDAMGCGLSLEEGVGPRLANTVRSAAEVEALPVAGVAEALQYVYDAVRLIRRELPPALPLIGFAGSPWTLACYMVEGGSSRDFERAKGLLYGDPEAAHELLGRVASVTVDYLHGQIEAGVQAVMLFDTWGGSLSEAAYLEFSLPYMERILRGLRERGATVPAIVFTKGGGNWLEFMAATGCQAVGLDWGIDIGRARDRIGASVALQGNMDPAVLRAAPERIRAEAARILEGFGDGPGHVFNLGHGITPDIDPDNVACLVDAVHSTSERIRNA